MSAAIGFSAGGSTRLSIDVSGVATFTSLPVCSVVPTTGNQLVNKTYVDGRPAPTLANVLVSGNSAGSTSINMNNQQITNGGDITSLTLFKAQGATPEFRLVDAGGTPAAGLAFTDATNLTELYCSDNLEIGPGGNTTINAGSGAFAFKNGGTDNFTVSGGGNTMRQNAPTGAQNFEMNTGAISQQSEIKFVYGTPGAGTVGFGIYRPVNTRSLSFYNYALAANQLTLDTNGTTNFQAGGVSRVSINTSGTLRVGTTSSRIDFGNAGGGPDGRYGTISHQGAAASLIINNFLNTPIIFDTNNTERMRIDGSGNVGIGTGTLTNKRLSIRGSGAYTGTIAFHNSSNDVPYVSCGYDQTNDGFIIGRNTAGFDIDSYPFFVNRVNGRTGLGTFAPGFQLALSTDSAGKPTTNTWTISSDERIKKNIEDANLEICYSNLKNIRLRRFEWDSEYYDNTITQDRHTIGFIAQEVKERFPKAVSIEPIKEFSVKSVDVSGNETIKTKKLDDFHSLNSDQIYNSHIGATKLLMKKVEELEAANAALLARLDVLEAKLA